MQSMVSFFVWSIFFTGLVAARLCAEDERNLSEVRGFVSIDSRSVSVMDIRASRHRIEIDRSKKRVVVESSLEFDLFNTGFPAFDMVRDPLEIKVDGLSVKSEEIPTPHRSGRARVLGQKLTKGRHLLEVVTDLTDIFRFELYGVSGGFWMNSFEDRGMLERYLPAGFRFDLYDLSFEIVFEDFEEEPVIFTNGQLKKINSSSWNIIFPAPLLSNGIYFHIGSKPMFEQRKWKLALGQKTLDLMVYSKIGVFHLDDLKEKMETLAKTTAQKMYVNRSSSLMIYLVEDLPFSIISSGAVVASIDSLEHALSHHFMENSSSGLDTPLRALFESIIDWNLSGREEVKIASQRGLGLGSLSPYLRKSVVFSEEEGLRAIGFLDFIVQQKKSDSSMIHFAQDWTLKNQNRPWTLKNYTADAARYFGGVFEKEQTHVLLENSAPKMTFFLDEGAAARTPKDGDHPSLSDKKWSKIIREL